MYSKKSCLAILLAIALIIAFQVVNAGTGSSHNPPHETRTIDNDTHIDINKIDMIVTNYASFGYDPVGTQGYGMWFPKGTDLSPLFAGGIFIGGYIDGELRVTACDHGSEFVQGTWPGMVIEEGEPYPDKPYYKVYKMNKTDLQNPNSAAYKEWMDGRQAALDDNNPNAAPPVDENGEPLVFGDQTLWSVFNDSDVNKHVGVGHTLPLGVEIRSTTFAFNREGALGHIIFKRLEIENMTENTIEDCYISVWADPDVGEAGDDMVGCDTTLSLGYSYNATDNDANYGAAPPAIGYDFFKGPLGDDGKILPMVSFNKYINGTDPDNAQQCYWYMLGLDGKTGNPVINPLTGEESKFYAPGDPSKGTGWIDSNPSDRRFMQNSGPFTFTPGEIQEVVIAVIVARGGNNLGSVELLKYYDTQAQYAFDVDFDLPFAPDKPEVDIVQAEEKIVLSWGNENYSDEILKPASEVYPRPEHNADDFAFEGYAVYQGQTPTGPWKLIETFDVGGNGKQWLWDRVYDNEAGALLWKPVIKGTDEGIKYEIELTRDYIRNQPLYNGTEYHYAVTAYSYDTRYNGILEPGPNDPATPGLLVLETAKDPITVMPRWVTAGTDLSVTGYKGDIEVTYHQEDDTQAPTTDIVSVDVIDPYLVTGHEYEVFWTPVAPIDSIWGWIYNEDHTDSTWGVIDIVYPSTPPAAPEQVEYKYTWNLKDKTTGALLLEDQWSKFGGEFNRVVDGIRVSVDGVYRNALVDLPPNDWWIDSGDGEDLGRGISWIGVFGGSHFYGGVFYGNQFFGSTLDPVEDADQFGTIQIIWKNKITLDADTRKAVLHGEPAGQYAYRYNRPGYEMTGFVKQPFEVWEVVGGEPVRQLNACFVEDVDSGVYDDLWMPPSYDYGNELGGREYLFIMSSTYDENGGMYDSGANWGPAADVTYAATLAHRGTHIIDPGDAFQFTWGVPGTDNDYYTFNTTPVDKSNLSLIEEELEKVKVVPNPYYGISLYENNQFRRVVKFTHLPQTCTIRIFNLAGDLVRTLEKDDESSIFEWNLYTKNDLPVASGIYIYHITAYEPGTEKEVGTKVGKMAIFMEKESLNTY